MNENGSIDPKRSNTDYWADFLTGLLKMWPLLVVVVGWAISVEIRMPAEVPPDWFREDVAMISEQLSAVKDEVADLRVQAGRIEATQEGQGKNLSALVVRLDSRIDAD